MNTSTQDVQRQKALQQLLATDGKFTYVVLSTVIFTTATRAILLVLSVTLSAKELRNFLDKFYAARDNIANHQQYLAVCVAIKAINDISNNTWLLNEQAKPQKALEKYLALPDYAQDKERKQYWRELAQKMVFDAIPQEFVTELKTTELLQLAATENTDYSWRRIKNFGLTNSQQDEVAVNRVNAEAVKEDINSYKYGINNVGESIYNNTNGPLSLIKYIRSEISSSLHLFLNNDILTDGMKIYLLEQAAILDREKFQHLLDHVYPISKINLYEQILAADKLNKLCQSGLDEYSLVKEDSIASAEAIKLPSSIGTQWMSFTKLKALLDSNAAPADSNGGKYSRCEDKNSANSVVQKAYKLQWINLGLSQREELLFAAKNYVHEVVKAVKAQFPLVILRKEFIRLALVISKQTPDRGWRVKN